MCKFLHQHALVLCIAIIAAINLPFLPFYQQISLLFTLPISFAVAVFFFSLHKNLNRFTYYISLPFLAIHLSGFILTIYVISIPEAGLAGILYVLPSWLSSAFFCIATIIFYLGKKFFQQDWYWIYLFLLLPIAAPLIILIASFWEYLT